MRVKILDAWCWGLPVISTTHRRRGARAAPMGISCSSPIPPTHFAEQLIHVLQDRTLAATAVGQRPGDGRTAVRLARGVPGVGSGLPLNILFVVPYAPTRIRTRPLHLIRALTANGHRVTVAALWNGSDEQQGLEAAVIGGGLRSSPSPWDPVRARSGTACARHRPENPCRRSYSWSPALSRRLGTGRSRRTTTTSCTSSTCGVSATGSRSWTSSRRTPARRVAGRVGQRRLHQRSLSPRRPAGPDGAACGGLATARVATHGALRRHGDLAGFARVLTTSEADRRGLLALAARSGRRAAADLAEPASWWSQRGRSRRLRAGGARTRAVHAGHVREDELPRQRRGGRQVRRRRAPAHPEPTPGHPSRGRRQGSRHRREGTRPAAGRGGHRHGGRRAARTCNAATLAVAPIQYGVGIQNKVLEALACATPVVATSAAVEALGAIARPTTSRWPTDPTTWQTPWSTCSTDPTSARD